MRSEPTPTPSAARQKSSPQAWFIYLKLHELVQDQHFPFSGIKVGPEAFQLALQRMQAVP